MCGIGAIINGKTEQITKLMTPIYTRGESNSFNEHKVIDNNVLSCNRLRIVGRDTGKQPVRNETRNIFAVLNGEIYNYVELKSELKKKGHQFYTETDTEILVHGYEEWGNNLPKFLDGQFSFIVYNKITKKYLATRDHYGIKPLYFAKEQETIYFGSELKQLVNFSNKIEEVLPGHFVEDGKTHKYYSLISNNNDDNTLQAISKIRTLFDDAVRVRCNTDLPIAVFLSGGIDSTAILATAVKYHNNITAIVVGNYWKSEDSDYKVAMQYCEEYNIPVIAKAPPTEEELFNMLPKIIKVTESYEPNLIKQAGLSLFLSKIAKENGFKVVLCGEGADEVFCGYPEFTKTHINKIKKLSFSFFNNLYRTQLQRVDRTSMANTIEVRVPFMDKKLVEYAINLDPKLKLKENTTKWILRKAMQDRLPKYIYDRKKVVLSEGMGHIGNSPKDGVFTERINSIARNQEFDNTKKTFSKYKIRNYEEAHYLKIYDDLNYSNLVFTNRPIANRSNSLTSIKKVLEVINQKKYLREEPHKITELIKLSIRDKKPIKLFGFWGIGTKETTDKIDFEAITHLKEYMNQIKQVFTPGIEFTFIIADKHGEMNGVSRDTSNKYTEDISKLLAEKGFGVIYLSSLWEKHGINKQMIEEELQTKTKEWWENIVNKELILENAKKLNLHKNAEESAKFYCVMRELEEPMLKKEFVDSIFHTYSDLKMTSILPNMPTIYMYARDGWCNAPWFTVA